MLHKYVPMKIIYITTGLGVGGAERQMLAIAEQFSALGHSVYIISLTKGSEIQPVRNDIPVYELNLEKRVSSLLSGLFSARKIVKSIEPDIVHSHMVHANIFSRALRLTIHINKLICTAHNKNEGGWLRMLAYRITDRLADISTNVSEEAVREFLKKGAAPQGRMLYVPNGINTHEFRFSTSNRQIKRSELGIADPQKVILAVGRLVEAKDYPNLLDAFSLVLSKRPHTRLVIIGDGPEKSKLTKRVETLGLRNNVLFTGIQRDINAWMCACDVFALSSAWEGFGLVVAEAMATERIVVATDCGGVKEVMGGHGFLVPAKNSGELANALISALEIDSTHAISLGHNARMHICKNYSISSTCKTWEDVYSKNWRNIDG